MKRAFIRCVWGAYKLDVPPTGFHADRKLERRSKLDIDIDIILKNKFNEPFVVYVFGKDNFDKMKGFGFDCVLASTNPAPFDQINFVYRNKMELIKYAMESDGYDEITYLDWDCVPQKKLPENYWEEMSKRAPIQACLQQYRRRKCLWRLDGDVRKVPNGGFVYIRDKILPSKAIEIWDTMKQDNDEPAWAKLIDDLMGGWKGMDEFWKSYETLFCNLHKMSPFTSEQLNSKNVCFKHFQG